MKISDATVVSYHFSLRDSSGKELETSRGREPDVYLHGANNLLGALEEAMTGREQGDVFSTTLAPEQAYGTRYPDRIRRVPVKHLVFRGKLRPGMVVDLNTAEGPLSVTVLKVGRHSVEVDTNHPLAGQTLNFDIEVLEVRAATPEEISHGHVHGSDCHHH